MSRQYWSECLAWATASGTAVNTTASETILFPNVTIPGNYLSDGRVLRLCAFGGYGTTATPTIIFRLRWGGVAGTAMATSGTYTTGSGVGGGASMTALWRIELIVQIRANGSSGTAMTNGSVSLWTTGVLGCTDLPIASGTTGGTTPVVSTLDLTADTALALTVQWGTSNAANSIQGHQYTVEALN